MLPKHHLGTTGDVTVSLGSEVTWWERSFPVFTTEIFYFSSSCDGISFNKLSFPPLHVPKCKFGGVGNNPKPRMLS